MNLLLKKVFLILYYGIAQYLPDSYTPIVGSVSNHIRIFCVKRIFKYCGKVTTINRRAYFGNGYEVEIGDFSGIGKNNQLPNDIKIGKYCMLAPNVLVLGNNHNYENRIVPMCFQGKTHKSSVVIEDDVWIGQNVIINAGKKIAKGSIVAAGSVVTKDFNEYSIIGGNPACLIKYR